MTPSAPDLEPQGAPETESPLESRLRATLGAVTSLDDTGGRSPGRQPAVYVAATDPASADRRTPALVAAGAALVVLIGGAVVLTRPTDELTTATPPPTTTTEPSGTTIGSSAAASLLHTDGYAYLVPDGLSPTVKFNDVSHEVVTEGPLAGGDGTVGPVLQGVVPVPGGSFRGYQVRLTSSPWKVTTIGYDDGLGINGFITIVAGAPWTPESARINADVLAPATTPVVDLDALWAAGTEPTTPVSTSATTGLRFRELAPTECVGTASLDGVTVGPPGSGLCISHVVGGNDDMTVLITTQRPAGTGVDATTIADSLAPVSPDRWAELAATASRRSVVRVRPDPNRDPNAPLRPSDFVDPADVGQLTVEPLSPALSAFVISTTAP